MSLRETNIEKLQSETFDVLILGGGINGAVSSAAIAGKGGKVALIDRSDFASFTSSNSSNLAWGGIKYMETFEFGLVRKLCMSRNHLIKNYPSTVQEIRFYTTHSKGFRHGLWKLFAGTWLYWLIGNGFTKPPRVLSKTKMNQEEPVLNLETADGGFEYSDAFLHDNDARFVFLFIRKALNYGCVAGNYIESIKSEFKDGLWHTTAKDNISNKTFIVKSKTLINSTGPYVDSYNSSIGEKTKHKHVFSKGIHLIVDKITPSHKVLTFFADDGRLFFVIPMGSKTCIGTTDTKVPVPETEVTPEDRKFVLENINKRLLLKTPLTEKDIISERCGVRPLVVTDTGDGGKDWMQLSRKHAVEVNKEKKIISIFGGKLTDCLNVGEEICDILDELKINLPSRNHKWYGEPSEDVKKEFFHQANLMGLDELTNPNSSEKLTTRLWRRYGSAAFEILEKIRIDKSDAEVLIEGAEYIKAEIEYAARHEMIVKLEDFLRRRSKMSLVVRNEDLKKAKGLKEACKIFFGNESNKRFDEYFKGK
ncbi:MAG: glycerol-3-phosphate dehydrogenase/oxidase [Leptospiraceae bacterium]|nr:glycerol-3-phosphate dehydrogenase/oxidase [Leptospiraceae bacterium]